MFYEAIKISSRLQVATRYSECVFTNRKSDDRLCCLKDIYTWQRSRNDYSEIRIRIMMIFTNQASTTRHLLWNRKDPLHLRNSKPNPTDIYIFFIDVFGFFKILEKISLPFFGLKTNEFFIVIVFFGGWALFWVWVFFKVIWRKRNLTFLVLLSIQIENSLKATLKQHLCTKKACVQGVRDRASRRELYRMYIYFVYYILIGILNLKLRFQCKETWK